jgi:uncharacterized protein YcaQ
MTPKSEHHDEFVDWACRERCRRLGFATRGEIAAFWDLLKPDEVAAWIAENETELETVLVESADGSRPRARCDFGTTRRCSGTAGTAGPRPRAQPVRSGSARPGGAERLFGFFYRIEIFVPEPKRVYGYYVFPILRGDRIVGRIDMKADRKPDVLAVRKFWPEKGVRLSKAFLAELEAELDRIRKFAGVTGVEYAGDWLVPD